MQTVYIMGAGASRHVGYPLVASMGKQWLEWMAAYPDGRFQGSVELLVECFGKEPDIEEMITAIESLIDSLETSEVLEEIGSSGTLLGNTRGQLSLGFAGNGFVNCISGPLLLTHNGRPAQ